MSSREYVPMYCDGCGAPLPNNLRCEYCGTRHMKTQRYIGADIPEERLSDFDLSQSYLWGTASSMSTRHIIITSGTSTNGHQYQ